MWNQLFVGLGVFFWDLFFLSFSKHAYTIFDISDHPWLPVLIWGFPISKSRPQIQQIGIMEAQQKGHGLWTQTDVGSSPCSITCKSYDLGMSPDLPEPVFPQL